MEQQTRYRISMALKRNLDSLKPHAGQIVEYKSIAFTVYVSGDKYVVLDSVIKDKKEYIDLLIGLDKGIEIIYMSAFSHNKNGVDTYPEYSGIIHAIIHNEFTSFRP